MKQKPGRLTLVTRPVLSPLHHCLSSSVAVQAPELPLVLLDSLGDTVGEVLPAVGDHVPGDAVLGGEGTGAGTQPREGGQVGAQPQVQRDAGAVDTKL